MLIVDVIKGMLGPWLSPVLDAILNNPSVTSAAFLIWFVVYIAGRMQLRQIEQRTKDLVLQIGRVEIAKNPQITAQALYKTIYPRWSEALSGWGWFIPHRLDLWVVPVTAKNVVPRMSFSPEWVANSLLEQNIPLAELKNHKQVSLRGTG